VVCLAFSASHSSLVEKIRVGRRVPRRMLLLRLWYSASVPIRHNERARRISSRSPSRSDTGFGARYALERDGSKSSACTGGVTPFQGGSALETRDGNPLIPVSGKRGTFPSEPARESGVGSPVIRRARVSLYREMLELPMGGLDDGRAWRVRKLECGTRP